MVPHHIVRYDVSDAINYGSFMAVTVRSIKHSFTDKSLTIPTAIISLMNADFNTIPFIIKIINVRIHLYIIVLNGWSPRSRRHSNVAMASV